LLDEQLDDKGKLLTALREHTNNSGDDLQQLLPETFLLPEEESTFLRRVEEEKINDSRWIMKPASGADGSGIEIFSNVTAIKQFLNKIKKVKFVASRYAGRAKPGEERSDEPFEHP